jgi:hypothetical protein
MSRTLIINIALGVIVVAMGYWAFRLIRDPIRQAKINKIKKEAIVERLKDIRQAEFAYREIHGKFTGDFQDLIQMYKRDTFQLVKTLGDPNDTTVKVERDTLFIPVKDSILKDRNYPIDSMPYIPYTDGTKFTLKADMITKGGVKVPVFMARDAEPFDPEKPLQVGSLSEATYSGNWE